MGDVVVIGLAQLVDGGPDGFDGPLLELIDFCDREAIDGSACIIARGAIDWYEAIKAELQMSGVYNLDLYYVGKAPLSAESISLLCTAIALEKDVSSYRLTDRGKETVVKLGRSGGQPAQELGRVLSEVKQHADTGDGKRLGAALAEARALCSLLASPDNARGIAQGVCQAQALARLEERFLLCPDDRSIAQLNASSFAGDLLRYAVPNLIEEYETLAKTLPDVVRPGMEARIEFLRLGLGYTSNYTTRLESIERGFFTWLSVYFLLHGWHYANGAYYAAAVAMSVRALEVYLQGILLDAEIGEFDATGAYLLRGEKPRGAGSFVGAARPLLRRSVGASGIEKLEGVIEARNRILIAHGVARGGRQAAESCLGVVQYVVESHEKRTMDQKKTWRGIGDLWCQNVLSVIPQCISAHIVERLVLKHFALARST